MHGHLNVKFSIVQLVGSSEILFVYSKSYIYAVHNVICTSLRPVFWSICLSLTNNFNFSVDAQLIIDTNPPPKGFPKISPTSGYGACFKGKQKVTIFRTNQDWNFTKYQCP